MAPWKWLPLTLLAAAGGLGLLPACGEADTETGTTATATDSCPDRFDWGWGGREMLPGTDCLSCHRSGGAAHAVFSVGGTVFRARDCREGLEGASVSIEDSAGVTLALTSNRVGNFHSTEPLAPPLKVQVSFEGSVQQMSLKPSSGGCGGSGCHAMEDIGLVFAGGTKNP